MNKKNFPSVFENRIDSLKNVPIKIVHKDCAW